MPTSPRISGFTLVELAIVLVIIGLLIGGVLVGQDLLRSATINATVRDIEKYDAAATTFRAKFAGLPGDLTAQRAFESGLNTTITDASRNGNPGLGDGNGVIEGGAAGSTNLNAETALFWSDLNKMGLISGVSSPYTSTTALNSITTSASVTTASFTAQAKISYAAGVHVFPNAGRNYYAIGGLTVSAGAVTGAANSSSAALTPLDGRGIDLKIDDGLPSTGIVIAIPGGAFASLTVPLTPITPVATGPNVCSTSDTTPPSYSAKTDASLNSVACLLAVRAAF